VTLNTLLLLQGVLLERQLSLHASREEIEAVLAARDELTQAIAEARTAEA
jgi:hypothetical protein